MRVRVSRIVSAIFSWAFSGSTVCCRLQCKQNIRRAFAVFIVPDTPNGTHTRTPGTLIPSTIRRLRRTPPLRRRYEARVHVSCPAPAATGRVCSGDVFDQSRNNRRRRLWVNCLLRHFILFKHFISVCVCVYMRVCAFGGSPWLDVTPVKRFSFAFPPPCLRSACAGKRTCR